MGPRALPVSLSTQQYLEKTQAVTASAIQRQVARCNESLISTHNLRSVLVRRLEVGVNTARLLVVHIVDHLTSRGILEEWDRVGKGDIYRINVERLCELTDEDVVG